MAGLVGGEDEVRELVGGRAWGRPAWIGEGRVAAPSTDSLKDRHFSVFQRFLFF